MLSKENMKKRDKFIEIKNNYDFSHISYNFLPNLIYKKMRFSMDIDEEVNNMEDKIEKLNSFIKEKEDEKTNLILTIISGIALVSSLIGISEWLQSILSVPQKDLPFFSITSITIILSTLLIVWIIKKNK